MTQFVLRIVYMSLVVLDLYKCCIILVSYFNWHCYVFFNVNLKNLAFGTKFITNAWFSMKN